MIALMTCDAGAHAHDTQRLADLWHRRAALSEMEMAQIYGIVLHALRAYYPAELRGLPEDKEELIAQFFYSRVLRLDFDQRVSHASAESAPSTAYALCAYFRRFLIDCLRSASVQRNLSIEVDGVQAEVDARPHAPDDPVETALAEHGLGERRVRELARAFIASLDPSDRIILAGSLGYYLNPLANVLLGRIVLKERLSKLQWAAVALAAAGITALAVGALGQLWISLVLCLSFASYGLLQFASVEMPRKQEIATRMKCDPSHYPLRSHTGIPARESNTVGHAECNDRRLLNFRMSTLIREVRQSIFQDSRCYASLNAIANKCNYSESKLPNQGS